jgi:hypothetical protein
MKCILFLLLWMPAISIAQTPPHSRYVNDTLYTTSGFKIYKGQTLYFGKGTGRDGKFKYINIKSETPPTSLANNSIVVKKLKNYGVSILGNGYIEIIGHIVYKDGSKGSVDIHMAFDRAIEDALDIPSELIVPDEYRNKKRPSVADEIEKLDKLYKKGTITKEEFEAEKKKLLEQ